MNFPFRKGPSGPLYTVIRFHFSLNLDYRNPISVEGKIWADCVAKIANDAAWSFTLLGQFPEEGGRKAVLIISWKSDGDSVVPSWTSTLGGSTPSPQQSPFTPLLQLLDSPPQVQNVAFRPPLSRVTLSPIVPPTDIITLYIPTEIDDAKLGRFNRQIHGFHNAFAHVSHEPAGEMASASRGWGLAEVERGEKRVKMTVHVLLQTWKSKEDEMRYKVMDCDEYETLFLKPLREMGELGVKWEAQQMFLGPIKENTPK